MLTYSITRALCLTVVWPTLWGKKIFSREAWTLDLYFETLSLSFHLSKRMLRFRWIIGFLFPLSILDFARNIECLFDHFTSWFNMFQSVRDQQVHCDHINIFMLFLISVDYPSFTRFHKKRLISWFWIMLILPGLSSLPPPSPLSDHQRRFDRRLLPMSWDALFSIWDHLRLSDCLPMTSWGVIPSKWLTNMDLCNAS